MKMELGLGKTVISLNYMKYGVILTNGCISILWERIWLEGVQLCMITPPIIPTKSEEDRLSMEIITIKVNLTKNKLRCMNFFEFGQRYNFLHASLQRMKYG